MWTWKVALLVLAPFVGAALSHKSPEQRWTTFHLSNAAEVAMGAVMMTFIVAALLLALAIVQGRRKEAAARDRMEQLAMIWWPAPAAGMIAWYVMAMIGHADKRVTDLEWFQGCAAAALMAGFGGFLYAARKHRRAQGVFRITSAPGELPVAEWSDETVEEALFYSYTGKARYRCWIELAPDGTPLFVHKGSLDRTARLRPPAIGALGVPGALLAEKLMRAYGYGVREDTEAAPWAELQAFRVTTDAEYYGLSTRGGDRLKSHQINHMIVAEFGLAWGDIIVTESKLGLARMRVIHRRLMLAFVQSRAEHMEQLRAQSAGAQSDQRPSTPVASLPEKL
jgi:hypothetical protein